MILRRMKENTNFKKYLVAERGFMRINSVYNKDCFNRKKFQVMQLSTNCYRVSSLKRTATYK